MRFILRFLKKDRSTTSEQSTEKHNTYISGNSSMERVEQSPKSLLNEVKPLVEELDKELGDIIVSIVKRMSERPAIWWEWLMLFTFGAFAGIGLGILISMWVFPRTITIPPQNITITI